MPDFDYKPLEEWAPEKPFVPQGFARGLQHGANRGGSSIWDNLLDFDDAALAIPRGIEGFFNSIWNLSDAVLGDALPDWTDERLFGRSDTFLGGTAEGMTQFLMGFMPGLGVAGKIGKATRAGKLGVRSQALLRAADKAPLLSRIGRDVAVGAGADFLAFDAHEARLSNFLKDQFGLETAVTDYLAADVNDSEFEGRMKNVIEGGPLGLAADVFITAIRGLKNLRKAKAQGAKPADLLEIQEKTFEDAAQLKQSVDNIRDFQEARGVDQTPPELRRLEDLHVEVAQLEAAEAPRRELFELREAKAIFDELDPEDAARLTELEAIEDTLPPLTPRKKLGGPPLARAKKELDELREMVAFEGASDETIDRIFRLEESITGIKPEDPRMRPHPDAGIKGAPHTRKKTSKKSREQAAARKRAARAQSSIGRILNFLEDQLFGNDEGGSIDVGLGGGGARTPDTNEALGLGRDRSNPRPRREIAPDVTDSAARNRAAKKLQSVDDATNKKLEKHGITIDEALQDPSPKHHVAQILRTHNKQRLQLLTEAQEAIREAEKVTEASKGLESIRETAQVVKGQPRKTYEVQIEGQEFRFYRDPDARVWKMADTDEILTIQETGSPKRDASMLDALSELRERARGKGVDEALGSISKIHPPRGVKFDAPIEKMIKWMDETQKLDDAGGGAFNPREQVPDHFAELPEHALRKFMNLENVAPDNRGWTSAAQAAAVVFDRATPKDAKPSTFIKENKKATSKIRDIAGLVSDTEIAEGIIHDAPLAQAGEDFLARLRADSAEKRAWAFMMQEMSRKSKAAAMEWQSAPEALRDQKALQALIALDREVSIRRVVRGSAAISGRDLVMHKSGFVGAARLEILARRTQLRGRAGEAVESLLREVAHAPEDAAITSALAAKAHRSPTWFEGLTEWWINAILGGGRTISVNMLSNAGVAVYKPLENMVGAGLAGNLPGMKEALLDFTSYVDNFYSAVKVGWDDGRAGQGRFLQGDKFSTGGPERAFTPEAFGIKEGGNAARIIHTMGKMRYATAVLTGTDSFNKHMSFHANAQHILRRVKMEQQLATVGKIDPAEAASFASKSVKELVWKNQVLNETVLSQRHFDNIKAHESDLFPTPFEQWDEARNRASAEWNADDSVLQRLATEWGSQHALTDTYTNPINRNGGVLERGASHIQDMAASIPVLKFFVPFVRTPTNLLLWAKDRSLDPALGFIRGWGSTNIRGALQRIKAGDFGAGLDLKAASKAERAALKEGRITKGELKLPNIEKMHNRYLKQMLGDIDLPPGVLPNSPEGKAAIKLAREEALGRLGTGVGGLASLFVIATTGNDDPDAFHITGRGPEETEQRKLLEATGWRPYSFHIPGVGYVEYRRFDPFATLIGTVADMVTIGQYGHNDDQTLYEALGTAMVGAIANNATNKTYMTGMKNLLEIALDPAEKWPRFFPKFAASFIPVGPAELSKALAGDHDPYMREVRGMVDAVMDKFLPYYGSSLDPQRNFLGEEVRRVKSLGHSALGQFANITVPAAFSEVSDDFIMKEIAGLNHAFMPPSTTRGGIELRRFKNTKGQSAYDRMLQLRKDTRLGGDTLRVALRKLIRSQRYQAMDPTSTIEDVSPRIDELHRIVGRFDRAALRRMMEEFPEVSAESIRIRRDSLNRKSALQQVR